MGTQQRTMALVPRACFQAFLLIVVTHGLDGIEWWQTAEGTADRLTKQSIQLQPIKGSATPFSGTLIELDETAKHQTVLGFGGALTQASAYVFKQLTPQLQQQLMALYYDGDQGIGYNMGRIPIHSCDFSPKIYTLDDMAGDYNLTYFDDSLTDDNELIIPLVNAAVRLPNSTLAGGKLFGSPWSPPAWMKDNYNMLGGGALLEEARGAWALYISKWITAYNKHLDNAVSIWGVTVQNEPEASQPWESCVYNASYEAEFVADFLGPRLEQDHPHVNIIGFDHNKDHLVDWADELFGANQKAAQYMDGLGFHWYAGNCFENVATVADRYPGKFMLATEATYELSVSGGGSSEDFVRNGKWSRGEGYGSDILGDLAAGAAGWVDWNIVLDHTGGPNHVGNDCDAPILANTSSQELYIHPQYYYAGHFSKFIHPGAVRVDTNVTVNGAPSQRAANDCQGWPAYGTCPDSGLNTIAFELGDVLVSVVMNCGATTTQFRMSYQGNYFDNSAPAHSIQTYLLPIKSSD